jgi:hypothetical protein
MRLSNEIIKQMVVQPERHINKIISHIDDVINYVLYEEGYVEPEIYITETSNVLLMRSVESHFSQWKMLKAQLSFVIAHIEPERHKALKLLSKKELKLLIASLKRVLDYEKCTFHCNESGLDFDESLLDEELISSLGCQEMEA